MQNGLVERSKGKLRDERLNETLFSNLPQARTAIQLWKDDFNHKRSHSVLGKFTPAELARTLVLQIAAT
jgi:putative transposase